MIRWKKMIKMTESIIIYIYVEGYIYLKDQMEENDQDDGINNIIYICGRIYIFEVILYIYMWRDIYIYLKDQLKEDDQK